MKRHCAQYITEHRYLLDKVAREAAFTAPVAIDLGAFLYPVLRNARKGAILPIDGILIRSWNAHFQWSNAGVRLGMRIYHIEGVALVRVCFSFNDQLSNWGPDFFVVDRKDYRRLYRIALRCQRDFEPSSTPPILPAEQAELLWKNTIGYLDRANLTRIKAYGGRPRRGVLLTGEPGNGKTMACRWIWEECRRRQWDWQLVTPDAYRQARNSCNAPEAVKQLFTVGRRGVIFFDDMDLALRDRETVLETEDQAVFLSALDGISVHEGVVFVFTTNCGLALIDRAFKRPGRLDLVLHFNAPDAALRRRLIERWHADILEQLDLDRAVASTDGYSFAEIEELKNLLIMHFMDSGGWNWGWALKQFDINRADLAGRHPGRLGFDQMANSLLDDAGARSKGMSD